MTDLDTLQSRIDAEFAANEKQRADFQAQTIQSYEGQQQRLQTFEQICESMREIWRPRMEALAAKFGNQVTVTPQIKRELRQVTFNFDSKLASVQLRFSVSTDVDVRKLVLDYNLDILPILMQYDRHLSIEFPLEAVNPSEIAQWIDDRIVDFVRAYLAMSQNEYYLKNHMVTDPVAGVIFPKFTAAATLERGKNVYYFISERTRQEFENREAAAGNK